MPECSQCGKAFDTQAALNNHSQVHRDDGPDTNLSLGMTHYAIGGVLLLVAGFVVLGNPLAGGGSPAGATATGAAQTLDNTDDPALGSTDAPVTIAYFGDYTCPICNRFEQRVFPGLKSQIVGDDVRFVKKNFPVVSRQSPQLAQASQAVWNQVTDGDTAVFWEWHKTVYDNQGRERSGWATQQRILELTGQVDGVSADTVRAALNQQTYQAEVQQDLREGKQLGVSGTPTFIIYNTETGEYTKLVGPQPVSQFRNAIKQVR